jgi:hypothetical protein
LYKAALRLGSSISGSGTQSRYSDLWGYT